MTYKKNKGGYESLVVYWLATTIYDLTAVFCKTYMSYKTNKIYTRTYDQMIQAARSGKQNIVEGSLENSTEGNLKLTGISKASYGELLEDYKDYLRQNNLPLWDKEDPRVLQIRHTPDLPNKSYKTYKTYMSFIGKPESFANLMITLCFKQSYLLSHLLKGIENKLLCSRAAEYSTRGKVCSLLRFIPAAEQTGYSRSLNKFIREGGFRENLFKRRKEYLQK